MLLAGALTATLGLGCAPIASQTVIDEAADLLERADRGGAEQLAKHEYWSAEAYLEAARMRQGHADHDGALRFARMARDFANNAFIIVQQVQ
ncbi:MAG: hypothetical protein ACI9MR_002362 [Myxococcota bacterium]|jgi:hypothetical protein